MNIFIVKDTATDCAEYIGEMLALWGCSFCTIIDSKKFGKIEVPSVAIVPCGTEVDYNSVKSFLGNGGDIILIAPNRLTLQSLDIDYYMSYSNEEIVTYLRQVYPLLSSYSHFTLPVLGRRIQPVPDGVMLDIPKNANVWAYMYEAGPYINDRPAIWTVPAGKGRITVFAYDVVECYRDLRQGRPIYAGWRPPREIHSRPSDLFGPDWASNYHATHLPLADFHPMLLLCLIEQLTDWPIPRIWQLPATSKSAVIISGDEDGGDPKYNSEICSFLDTIDANMVIYVLMQTTKSSPEHIGQIMKNGHRFSVHPYPTEKFEHGNLPYADPLKKIEKCVSDFRTRYNLDARTIVNHRVFWTGYMDIPKLWERLGIQMDANYGLTTLNRKFEDVFSKPAATLPMSFMDENFRRINVLQHVRAISDCVFLSQNVFSNRFSADSFESYGDALISQTLKPLGMPVGVCFHPVNYCTFAGEAERRFLYKAKSHNSALLSDYEWLDFWKMRSNWKLSAVDVNKSKFCFAFSGNTLSRQLSISLPKQHKDKTIKSIEIDGKQTDGLDLYHFGQKRTLAILPDSVSSTDVVVEYH